MIVVTTIAIVDIIIVIITIMVHCMIDYYRKARHGMRGGGKMPGRGASGAPPHPPGA